MSNFLPTHVGYGPMLALRCAAIAIYRSVCQRWPNIGPTLCSQRQLSVGLPTLAQHWTYVGQPTPTIGWFANVGPTLDLCCAASARYRLVCQRWPNIGPTLGSQRQLSAGLPTLAQRNLAIWGLVPGLLSLSLSLSLSCRVYL